MPDDAQADITTLPEDIRAGKPSARDRFARRVEGELREIAARFMRRERADHLLQPTALINEAFGKLLPGQNLEEFANRDAVYEPLREPEESEEAHAPAGRSRTLRDAR